MKRLQPNMKSSHDQIIVGNGSTEILHLIPRALQAERALIPAPSYADYASSSVAAGLEIETFLLQESNGFRLDLSALAKQLRGREIVFLCQPNNPTGLLFDADELRRTASANPSTIFVIDEAFGPFVQDLDSLTRNRPENVIVLLSLTKIYAIPGLRLGCAIADREIINSLRSDPASLVGERCRSGGRNSRAERHRIYRAKANGTSRSNAGHW